MACLEYQSSARSANSYAGYIDGPLPAPVCDEARDPQGVFTGQCRAKFCLADGSDDPAAEGRREFPECRDRHGGSLLGRFHDLAEVLAGDGIKRVGVFACDFGGAGKRAGNAWPERVFHDGENLLAHPYPREHRVDIVRIPPEVQALRATGSLRGCSIHRVLERRIGEEKRAQHVAANRWDARDAAGPRAPCNTEQHLLRLIVKGVCGEHPFRVRLREHRVERRVSGIARGSLGPRAAPGRHVDATSDDRIKAERGCLLRRCPRNVVRPRLQAMIDNDRACPPPQSRRLERRCRGERQGVGTARQRDKQELRLRPSRGR